MPATLAAGVAELGGAIASGAGALGIGEATAGVIGDIAAPALLGAGLGAGEQALTGGDIGKGALFGGLTGGAAGGLGAALGPVTGGATAGGASAASVAPAGGLPAGTLSADLTSAAPVSLPSDAQLGASLSAGATTPDVATLAGQLPGVGAAPGTTGISNLVDQVGNLLPGGGGSGAAGGATPGAGAAGTAGTSGGAGGASSPWSLNKLLTPGNLIGLGGVAMNLGHTGNTPLENQLQSQAQSAGALGGLETQFLTTGKLPPGVQSIVDAQTQAGEAQVRSQFASLGLSGSTMEAQAIASVKQSAALTTVREAQQLLNSGVAEANLSGNLYNMLIQQQTAQNKDLTDALAGFAAAASGGGYKPS